MRGLRTPCLGLAAVVAAAGAASAQDRAETTALEEAAAALLESEEVIVSAPRPHVTPLRWPGGRTTIGPTEIRESGANTLQEVLRRTPGFALGDETDSDSKPNFGLRGIAPSRAGGVAMLIDGVPMAPAPYAHPGQSLFPFLIERAHAIDVYRGGYSVRYGPNNVAGVINFLTRPIPLEPLFEERVKVGSHRLLSTYTAVGGTWGDFGLLFEDAHRRGDTWRDNGEFRLDNQAVKASWRISDLARLLVQYESFDDDSRLAGGFDDLQYETTDPRRTVTQEDKFDGWQDRLNARLVVEPQRDEHWELHAYAYGGKRTFIQGSPARYGPGDPSTLNDNDRRATVWAVQALRTGPVRFVPLRNSLTVGARYHDELFLDRPTRHPFPGGPVEIRADRKFDYHVLSLFGEWEVEPVDRLTVKPGLRWEDVNILATDRLNGDLHVHKEFRDALPALGASYALTDEWSVFGNWQKTFRPPTYSQIEVSTTPQDVGNETATTWELGTRGRFLGGAVNPELTHFFIDYRNRLAPDPNQADVVRNIGRQDHRGTEFRTDVELGKLHESLDGFSVYGGWTHLKVRLRTGDLDGKEGPGAPPDTWVWGARWRHPSGFRAGVDGLHVREHFSDPENSDPPSTSGMGLNPSYTLWSARVGWDRTFLEGRCRAGVEVGMTNVFDEEYFDRNSNRGIVPGAPRQVYLQVGVSFDL